MSLTVHIAGAREIVSGTKLAELANRITQTCPNYLEAAPSTRAVALRLCHEVSSYLLPEEVIAELLEKVQLALDGGDEDFVMPFECLISGNSRPSSKRGLQDGFAECAK